MLGPHKASPAGEDGAAGSAWNPTRTVSDPIEASLVLDRAADLTIEGTYLILNAFVLHDPNDPLTKSGGLSPEKNARAK